MRAKAIYKKEIKFMREKWKNNVNVQGFVFSHTLTARISKAGVPFINGEIQVATDESGTNVVPVHFSYVSETYGKSGKPNATYGVLQEIIENGKTFEEVGPEATKVRISGNVEVNDFYTREGELASPKRIGGSFVHTMTGGISDNPANFDVDMVITNVAEREVEDAQNYVELKGYVFNFRNDILPVSFTIRSQAGMDYFLNADISSKNPMVTELQGEIISTVIKSETEIEGAFGEPMIKTTSRTLRAWDVTWASAEPAEFDDEAVITRADVKKALAKREEDLIEVKKKQEEYQASKNGKSGFPASTPVVEDEDDDSDFVF